MKSRKRSIKAEKHGGGSMVVRHSFAASGPGQLSVTDGTVNLYKRIVKANVFVTSS